MRRTTIMTKKPKMEYEWKAVPEGERHPELIGKIVRHGMVLMERPLRRKKLHTIELTKKELALLRRGMELLRRITEDD
jgi:hypothetical protein